MVRTVHCKPCRPSRPRQRRRWTDMTIMSRASQEAERTYPCPFAPLSSFLRLSSPRRRRNCIRRGDSGTWPHLFDDYRQQPGGAEEPGLSCSVSIAACASKALIRPPRRRTGNPRPQARAPVSSPSACFQCSSDGRPGAVPAGARRQRTNPRLGGRVRSSPDGWNGSWGLRGSICATGKSRMNSPSEPAVQGGSPGSYCGVYQLIYEMQ